ncbi:hypothetical protein [Streptomyces phaeolivaceus]|nr:hypothetical protein [Streptomyces phaeolivaceus]
MPEQVIEDLLAGSVRLLEPAPSRATRVWRRTPKRRTAAVPWALSR